MELFTWCPHPAFLIGLIPADKRNSQLAAGAHMKHVPAHFLLAGMGRKNTLARRRAAHGTQAARGLQLRWVKVIKTCEHSDATRV